MPLYHCNKCDHEWESYNDKIICQWCGSDGYILAEETELEKFFKLVSNTNKEK